MNLNQVLVKPKKRSLLDARETFLEWSQSVDINCYTKMMDYKGNYLVQFIWFLILLGSTGATFFLIAKSIMDYLKYDVVTQIKIVNEIPTPFPTITFCDNNPFSSKEAEEFMKNISLLNNLHLDSYQNVSTLFQLAKLRASSKLLSDEYKRSFTPLTKLTKPYCYFQGKDCLADLHFYWSYDYGNCLQFNSGSNATNQRIELINVTRKGKEFGLLVGVIPLINLNSLITTSSAALYLCMIISSSLQREFVWKQAKLHIFQSHAH